MKKKLENFWYHYKTRTLLGGAFVIILIICAVQFFTRTEYDLFALYAGPANINISIDGKDAYYLGMSDSFKKISGENDLEITIQCLTYIPESEADEYEAKGIYYNPYQNNETRQMFTSVIAAGKCSILMLTPDLYKEAKENGALAPLSETLGYTPDNAFDEYSVLLSVTEFASHFDGFSDLPEDTLLCLRNRQSSFSLIGMKNGTSWEKQNGNFQKNH